MINGLLNCSLSADIDSSWGGNERPLFAAFAFYCVGSPHLCFLVEGAASHPLKRLVVILSFR